MRQTTTFLLTAVLGIITPTSGATWLGGVPPVISEANRAAPAGEIDAEIELPASRLGAPKSPTGACCHEDGACDIVVEAECDGDWLGAYTACDLCPCVVPCPPGAVAESEPCGSDLNGGCNMSCPMFSPIEIDVPVCGTIWADGGTRDTDWYEIIVTSYAVYMFVVEAEFPQGVVCGLVATNPPGSSDCATASHLSPYATGGECQQISITTDALPPGTYWFFVSTLDYYGLPCGENNDYVCMLTGGVATRSGRLLLQRR